LNNYHTSIYQSDGCPLCSKEKYKNNFILKSNIVHQNKYDYSLVEYIKAHKKVIIICPIHGEFKQRPNDHLSGYGCIKCSDRYNKKDECINNFNKIHNYKYDYSLVNYKNNKIEIKIICPIHGIFIQRPDNHLNGNGCPKCVGKNRTTEEFNNIANMIHNNKYTYPDEYINATSKIKIICPIHGIFKQTPSSHINNKQGCPFCIESKGEIIIKQILNDKNIKYESEKRFKNCKYKNLLPFDFYLPNYNICIEFDGIQHFKSIKYFGGEKRLIEQKIKDKIKNEHCKNNNIHLLRIRYDENVEEKLNRFLKITFILTRTIMTYQI